MAITAFGYMGVRGSDLEEWAEFAQKFLGMQLIEQGKSGLSFRVDDYRQRFAVSPEEGEDLAFMGWEVDAKSDLDHYGARVEAYGIEVHVGSSGYADQRFVENLIYFDDPEGNRVELYHNPMLAKDPFVPGRPITGFKTGPYGLGHAALHVTDAHALLPFYRDVLDFKVSDYGLTPFPLFFLHVNGRHHSFAMVGSGKSGLHHLMVEYQNLDDVGQGFDLIQQEEDKIAYTLGRHTNDYMTSYYSITPSGFFIESGWGGRVIDPETWEPHETTGGPSFWGHERMYLPEEPRAKFRDMRMDLASKGIQAPIVADCPWLYEVLTNHHGKSQ